MKLLNLSKLLAFIMILLGISGNAMAAKKVACMGNSITYGATINDPAQTYPARLQELLGGDYEVKNFGCNSQTVQMNGYDLTDGSKPGDCAYRNKQQYKDALAYKPDVVVIKLGTNDSKNINWTAESPVNFRKDLCDMIEEIQANSNPEIYLCYPLRVKREDWTINEKNIHEIMDIINDVATEKNLKVINLHTAFDKELGYKWDTVYNDGVHPNAAGAGIIASYVAQAILNGVFPDKDDTSHPAVTKIACMGGMRTFGIGASDFATKSYPGVLATLLGDGYEVANYGVGNRTIVHKGTEKDPAVESSPIPCAFLDHGTLNTVANSKADIIFIDLGEMDAKPWNWAHKDEFASDFTEIVERIRKGSPDSKIYVCLPPRLRNNANESGIDGKIYIEEVVPALRAVAEELGLPVVDNTDILKDDAALYSGSYNLSEAGHATVAATLYTFLTGKEAPHATRVACMGNSITAGATINDEADKYPAVLQRLLGEEYEVRNYGQNSQTVQMHGRDTADDSKDGDCAYRNKDTYRNALAFMPEIVVIKLGTNDSKDVNWRENSPEVFRQDLCDMLDEIKENSNPKIYLALPIRVKREDWTINEKNIHIIIDILKDVAEERGLDVINLHTAFDEEFGDDWETVYNDGVHPNATGAAVIAQRVADAILEGKLGSASVTHPMRTVPVISCMGGLRTFGNTLEDRDTEAYPALLQEICAENDIKVKVTNAGVGNRTVLAEGNEKADGTAPCGFIKNDQFRSKVTGLAPDIVTIDLGDKDATAWNWGALKDSFHSDYTDIINAIKDSNPSVKIYVCIPPRTLDDANAANVDGVMLRDEVIPAIREVAEANKVNLLDLNEVMTPECYQADKYHLNARGHEVVAQRIFDEIRSKGDLVTEVEEIIPAAEAISTVYFDLTGRIVRNPSEGIYIVKTTFSNGNTTTKKTVVNPLSR